MWSRFAAPLRRQTRPLQVVQPAPLPGFVPRRSLVAKAALARRIAAEQEDAAHSGDDGVTIGASAAPKKRGLPKVDAGQGGGNAKSVKAQELKAERSKGKKKADPQGDVQSAAEAVSVVSEDGTMVISDPSGSKSAVRIKIAQKPKVKRLNPPKRPSSLLQLITEETTNEYKQKGALTRQQAMECFRIAAGRLAALTPEEKAEWEIKLAKRREEHAQALAEFIESLTPADYVNEAQYQRERRAQGRRASFRGLPKFDPEQPKRPANGFILFMAEMRERPERLKELGGEDLEKLSSDGRKEALAEGSKVLAAAWKNLREDVKEHYLALARKAMEDYQVEKAAYDARKKAEAAMTKK